MNRFQANIILFIYCTILMQLTPIRFQSSLCSYKNGNPSPNRSEDCHCLHHLLFRSPFKSEPAKVKAAARQEEEGCLLLPGYPLQLECPFLVRVRLSELHQLAGLAIRAGKSDLNGIFINRRSAAYDQLRGTITFKIQILKFQRDIVPDAPQQQ